MTSGRYAPYAAGIGVLLLVGCSVPKQLQLAMPVPESQRFQVQVDRLWRAASTAPAGWEIVARDDSSRFVTYSIPVKSKVAKELRPFPPDARPKPGDGTIAVSLLIVARGDSASEALISSRLVGPRGADRFFDSNGNVERAVLASLATGVGVGGSR